MRAAPPPTAASLRRHPALLHCARHRLPLRVIAACRRCAPSLRAAATAVLPASRPAAAATAAAYHHCASRAISTSFHHNLSCAFIVSSPLRVNNVVRSPLNIARLQIAVITKSSSGATSNIQVDPTHTMRSVELLPTASGRGALKFQGGGGNALVSHAHTLVGRYDAAHSGKFLPHNCWLVAIGTEVPTQLVVCVCGAITRLPHAMRLPAGRSRCYYQRRKQHSHSSSNKQQQPVAHNSSTARSSSKYSSSSSSCTLPCRH